MEAPAHHTTSHTKPSSASRMLMSTALFFVTVLAILTIGALIMKVYLIHPTNRDVKTKQYQALFLTNGQVYFGKLTGLDSSYVKLTDIYYLQTQAAQPSTGSNSAAATQQSLSLAKLGNELHGPEDAMYVAKTQVLFWENLKDDGKVVQAIKSYQASKK